MTRLEQVVRADSEFGFLDSSAPSEHVFHPLLISNERQETMLWAIRHELRRSRSFVFSVAFVNTAALALLKQALLDFSGTGVLITSTYLNFNTPDVFRELATLEGVEVLVHEGGNRGFHPKGYVFEQDTTTTAIIGSSNLTDGALLRNREWNLRFSALPDGDMVTQLRAALARQQEASIALTSEWIDAYEAHYLAAGSATGVGPSFLLTSPDAGGGEPASPVVHPNRMQSEALAAISQVREAGERRAVVVSATGTGKTILSALDVRQAGAKRVLFVAHREQILDASITAYQRVLGAPPEEFGKFSGDSRELDRRYVFATIQSIARPDNLATIDPGAFDYVLIDEVHRAGADSYRRLIEHLRPDFLLGLTATPERTDGFDIYRLFDYNVPYEIRLNEALESDMLAPFHYYGVTDFEDGQGAVIDETSSLAKLTAPERVDHVVRAMERYGHVRGARGLIFCARRDEASELSVLLNQRSVHGRPLRTMSLSGVDSIERREEMVRRLEAGELDYLLSVDIFNEGVDIPSLNQVVMLRQTQSAIIFTQQLGRGLRKFPGKDHLRVIDFIGNYANNFLIPVALLGDSSLNKDLIRQRLIQIDEAGAIAGLSSVNFDRISRTRVLKSLSQTRLDSRKNLKAAFLELERRLGKPPALLDFARFDTVDPVVMATKDGNYWSFLHVIKQSRLLGRVPGKCWTSSPPNCSTDGVRTSCCCWRNCWRDGVRPSWNTGRSWNCAAVAPTETRSPASSGC